MPTTRNKPGSIAIAHLLSQVPYNDLNPVEIALPPRQSDSDYKRPKLTSQHFVPDIY